jgi:sugar O-acyltransferase (sialic acid O-acetyltransferase NeuD family)
MIEDIIIIGAGGFGREVKTLIDQINKEKVLFKIKGFYDDNPNLPTKVNGLPVLGTINDLINTSKPYNIALAIGSPNLKADIILRLKLSGIQFKYPVLIHPSANIGMDDIHIGKGSIICAGNILTCNIKLEEFVTLNLVCTVGHDSIIRKFSSLMPNVNVSGDVIIEEEVYIGTGAKIINNLKIGKKTIVGSGAVVSKTLPENCTAVGIPAKPIKFNS